MQPAHKAEGRPEITALATIETFLLKARGAMVRQRRVSRAARWFAIASVAAAATVVVGRLAGLSAAQASWMLAIALLGALLGAVLGGSKALPDAYRLAKQIDQQLGLQDRLAGGYDLLRQGHAGDRDAFTGLVIKDALAAVEEARRRHRSRAHLPRVTLAGLGCLVAAMVVSLLAPQRAANTTSSAVSARDRQQAQAFNKSLASVAEAIKAFEGVDDKQQEAMLEALRQIQISDEDLKKMSRADIIRRLREASSTIKLPEGAQASAIRQAMEDKLRAVAEMEQVQQQLAQIDQINARSAAIDLGGGKKALALNIRLESSDLQIDKAIATAAAKPGEAEQDFKNRLAAAAARDKAQRETIKKFLAHGTEDVRPSDVQKLAAIMDNDAEFQGKVMEAIKDPSGKKLDDMRAIYRRQLQSELEKEKVPRGLRQQLSTYLGPIGAAPSSSGSKGVTP
jgi:hypothetical protein